VKLVRLEIENFTAFEHAVFDFSSGVNVLIGENGTGKSHVLKLIYCLSEAIRRHSTGEGLVPSRAPGGMTFLLAGMLQSVFQPDELGRLVRHTAKEAQITSLWKEGELEHQTVATLSSGGLIYIKHYEAFELERSVFFPTREVLSIFPGFISSYMRRELSFDLTIYDLCVALDAKPLRNPPEEVRKKLLEPIEEALGGEVVNEQGRFYLRVPGGKIEAPLVAEGIRKLAMLDYLIANGSLSENGFLLWDEPEASLNPKLTRLTSQVAMGLARSGIQTWIATHDYLLTSELDLAVEQGPENATAFFALTRESNSAPTTIERGDKLAELEHNSILEAFSDLHRREELAFIGEEK
jgi:energy-coupling factor transporter ATP-binding protein EcfA2